GPRRAGRGSRRRLPRLPRLPGALRRLRGAARSRLPFHRGRPADRGDPAPPPRPLGRDRNAADRGSRRLSLGDRLPRGLDGRLREPLGLLPVLRPQPDRPAPRPPRARTTAHRAGSVRAGRSHHRSHGGSLTMPEFVDIPSPGWPLEFGEPGRPAVVIVHDAYGRLPYLESYAKALAHQGFFVLVPDL